MIAVIIILNIKDELDIAQRYQYACNWQTPLLKYMVRQEALSVNNQNMVPAAGF